MKRKAVLLKCVRRRPVSLWYALYRRLGLRLDITGAADPQIDRPVLAWAPLHRQLQKRKFVQDPSAAQKRLVPEDLALTREVEARWLFVCRKIWLIA